MRKGIFGTMVLTLFALALFAGVVAAKEFKPKKAAIYYDFNACKAVSEEESECYCITGKFSCTAGVQSRGVVFHGLGDHFIDKNVATKSFTVLFWIKTDLMGMNKQNGHFEGCTGIVDASNPDGGADWGVNLCGSKIGFGVENTTIHSKKVTTGKWVFVAATRDFETGDMKLYINGELVAEAKGVSKGVVLNGSPDIYIGGLHAPKGYVKAFYTGAIDELVIYDRVLSPKQIRKIYKQLNPYGEEKKTRGEELEHKEHEYEPGHI